MAYMECMGGDCEQASSCRKIKSVVWQPQGCTVDATGSRTTLTLAALAIEKKRRRRCAVFVACSWAVEVQPAEKRGGVQRLGVLPMLISHHSLQFATPESHVSRACDSFVWEHGRSCRCVHPAVSLSLYARVRYNARYCTLYPIHDGHVR